MVDRETTNRVLFQYINILHIQFRIGMKHFEPARNLRSFVS